jgi:hypothetical protein
MQHFEIEPLHHLISVLQVVQHYAFSLLCTESRVHQNKIVCVLQKTTLSTLVFAGLPLQFEVWFFVEIVD